MRRRSVLAALTFSAVALAGRRRGGAQEPEKIRVAGIATEDSTNMYYGVKNGIFKRYGVEVEMVFTASGAAGTAAVIAGSYEMARTAPLVVFQAHLRDVPIIIVAPEFEYNVGNTIRNTFAALQVAADSPFKTAADLNGKTLGTTVLSGNDVLMIDAWVDKNGGDWRSLKFVEIPNTAMPAAIAEHRVDAAQLYQPQLDLSLAAGTTKTLGIAAAAIAPAYVAGTYVAGIDWASQHGDALRKFNRALREATLYVNGHLSETAPLVAELTKLESSSVVKMHRTSNPTTINVALIQPVIDAAFRYGLISRAFPARDILWSSLA